MSPWTMVVWAMGSFFWSFCQCFTPTFAFPPKNRPSKTNDLKSSVSVPLISLRSTSGVRKRFRATPPFRDENSEDSFAASRFSLYRNFSSRSQPVYDHGCSCQVHEEKGQAHDDQGSLLSGRRPTVQGVGICLWSGLRNRTQTHCPAHDGIPCPSQG